MDQLGLDAARETPGRGVVRLIGESLVEAMELARQKDLAEGALLVACEAVVQAETKDHLNWELLHEASEKAKGDERNALGAAYGQVEEQEDEHLFHSSGWCRELWIESLGLPAIRPDAGREHRRHRHHRGGEGQAGHREDLHPHPHRRGHQPGSGRAQRRRADRGHEGGAEQITREVKGVRDVINNLRIQAAAR